MIFIGDGVGDDLLDRRGMEELDEKVEPFEKYLPEFQNLGWSGSGTMGRREKAARG